MGFPIFLLYILFLRKERHKLALFKIAKGSSENINATIPTAVEGFCYFNLFDKKFYIDTKSGTLTGTNPTGERVALNANVADYAARAGFDINGFALNPFNAQGQILYASSNGNGGYKLTTLNIGQKGQVLKVDNNSIPNWSALTISDISGITASAAEINILDGLTATTQELNYVDGVTSNIQTQLNKKAPLASPVLTGTPTAPTAAQGTNTTQIATTAFVKNEITNEINNFVDVVEAHVNAGTVYGTGIVASINSSVVGSSIAVGNNISSITNYKAGWEFRVISAGLIADTWPVEPGDWLLCIKDSNSFNVSDWTVIQNNLDITTTVTSDDTKIPTSAAVMRYTNNTYLPLTGGTMPGNIIINNSNPHLGLQDTTGNIAYFQTYDDGSGLKAGFGYGWVNSLKLDQSGNMSIAGSVYEGGTALSNKYAPKSHSHGYIQDGTVGIKSSDSNEISFASNNNVLYFGYDNRLGSTALVDTYKFGTHSGVDNSASGRIECGSIGVSGAVGISGGAYISGRYFGSGDDEGLVIGRTSNNYAGLILGSNSGVRSVMYLMPDNSAVWRYNNGSASYDVKHPAKAGTMALTSDLSGYLPLTGGTLSGSLTINDSLNVSNKIIQGNPSSSDTISSMNKFEADLFVAGNGSAPNGPSVPGFYLGKSTSDENRHMDIVSGSDYAYIDFNKASVVEDYKVRLIANVGTGATQILWGPSATNKTFDFSGGTVSATTFIGNLTGTATSATKATQDGSGNTITSTYVKKAGDTLTGNLNRTTYKGGGWISGRDNAALRTSTSTNTSSFAPIVSAKTQLGSWDLGPCHPNENFYFSYATDTNYNAGTNTTTTTVYIKNNGVLMGAAWNDYAEYRISDCQEPGRVICENGDDTLSLAIERLQPAGNVISDTFGFAIGETEMAKTPIAVSGRVLVYPYEDRYSYNPGDAVCAAPGGTVSKMTREEIITYPERIIGTVSAIPEYETWGEGNVPVNGRIWIKVK